MTNDAKGALSDEVERLMDIVGDVVGSETPEGKDLLMVIARWEVAEGEAKACAERLREVEGSWHLAYNENLALRQDVERAKDVVEVARLCAKAQTLSVGIIRDSLQKAIERYDDARP